MALRKGEARSGSAMSPPQDIAATFYGELSHADKQLARSGQMALVIAEKLGQYGVREGQIGANGLPNPFKAAIKLLDAQPPSKAWRKESTWRNKKQTIKRWAVAVYDEKRDTDKARNPADKVAPKHWLLFKQVLTSEEFKWQDVFGNKRRQPSIESWRDGTKQKLDRLLRQSAAQQQANAAVIAECREHLAAVEEVLQQTRWNIHTLLQRVVQKYQLHGRHERFKPTRPRLSSRRIARMLRSEIPLTEVLFTLEQVKQNAAGDEKEVPEYRQLKTTAKQQKYVAMMAGDKKKYEPLYYDEGAFHITANIDGASVYVDGDINFGANTVYYAVRVCAARAKLACEQPVTKLMLSVSGSAVLAKLRHAAHSYCSLCLQPGEYEEYYDRPATKNNTSQEKQYYLVITLAGHGVLAAAALKSGTRKVQQEGDMVYWFDLLVKLGIGTKELEDELRARVWKVRCTVRCQLLACACAQPQPPARKHPRPRRAPQRLSSAACPMLHTADLCAHLRPVARRACPQGCLCCMRSCAHLHCSSVLADRSR